MTSKKSKGKQKLINNNKSLPPMSPCPKGKRSVKVPKVIVEDVIDILDSEDDNKKEESNVHSGDDDVDSDYMAMDEDDGNEEDGDDNDDDDGNDEDGDDNDNDDDGGGLYIENNDVDFDDTISRKQKNYTVLSEEDIRHRQEEDITRICAVLSISRVSAAILLCNYNWSVSNVHDAWFADEENVRKTVGLVEKPVVQYPKSKKVTCGICFDNYRHQEMSSAACGHLFCSTCWKGYISTSINDGPGCLILRCPDPSCGVAVGQDMISILDSDEHKDKYSRYLLRSYVEANRKTKWCPAPGCEYAVDFVVGSGTYDVLCNCTYTFCWNCLEEGHRPVDCDTVSKWILKNSAESENVNWILANSKPCPKCKRPIEKNHGCMHMTCTPPCKFQFCWLCLGSWTDHGNRTGGYYSCNRYAAAKKDGEYEESEKRREMAKKSLERYTHYYERWATNHSSRLKAVGNLQEMQTVHIEKLIDQQCQLKSQLKFITDAWLQIIECRRVLKWTYAYGYYLPEQEDVKRNFFEYLQGQAESGLERLHKCAEKDLAVYLDQEGPSNDFNEFRTKLTGLTTVTRNYFENLVRALENGLADVDSHSACSKTGSSKSPGGGKKGKGGKSKGKTSKSNGDGQSQENHNQDNHSQENQGSWTCEHCTYLNDQPATICLMCNRHHGAWSCGFCTYFNTEAATSCQMCSQIR